MHKETNRKNNETKQWNHNSRGWKVKTKWGRERHNSPNITPTHNSPCSSVVGRAEEKRRKALLLVSSAAAGRAGCNSLECLSNPPQPQINYNWKPLPVFTGFHHKKIPRPTLSLLAPNCTCLEEIVLTHLGVQNFIWIIISMTPYRRIHIVKFSQILDALEPPKQALTFW